MPALQLLMPLHHGAESPEGANFAQRFIDSDLGTFAGSFFHSVGALVFTAGIVGFVLAARALGKGEKGRAPALAMLPYAQAFTVLGIGMNGAGGLMRLLQSDHPGLEQLGTSLWVQVLVVKHLFLLAGVGLALWVSWKTFTLRPEERPQPPIKMSPRNITTFAVGSFLTILLATVLGAVAGQTPLPGAETDPLSTDPGMDHVGQGPPSVLTYQSSGNILATPVQPAEERALGFFVPSNTSRVDVLLTWSSEVSILDLRIESEDGVLETENRSATASSVRLVFEEVIGMGNWTVFVTSSQAANEDFSVRADVHLATPDIETLEGTVTLVASPPGAPVVFFEINLDMDKGKRFDYSWDVVGADLEVYFNIHTHRNNEVQYPVEGYSNDGSGNYTQDEDGGVSLMWENRNQAAPNPQPVEIHYVLVGQYTLDSTAGIRNA